MRGSRTAFRDGFNRLVDEAGVTAAEISRATGVPKTLIDKLRQGRADATNVHDAIRLARFFSLSVEEVAGRKIDPDVADLMGMLTRLSPEEREMVQAQLEGLFARRKGK